MELINLLLLIASLEIMLAGSLIYWAYKLNTSKEFKLLMYITSIVLLPVAVILFALQKANWIGVSREV